MGGTVEGMSTTRRRRWALILLVIVAAGGCLALGWWQWSRWESATGSFQNLGYAMQWPAFAVFCVYAYRKFVRLEDGEQDEVESDQPTEIPADLLPQRPQAAPSRDVDDPALAEYNAYLAELAQKQTADQADHDRQDRTTA
jgi:DNA-binding transcriptional regulator of glucitol operon